jgi:hypothetical protein
MVVLLALHINLQMVHDLQMINCNQQDLIDKLEFIVGIKSSIHTIDSSTTIGSETSTTTTIIGGGANTLLVATPIPTFMVNIPRLVSVTTTPVVDFLMASVTDMPSAPLLNDAVPAPMLISATSTMAEGRSLSIDQ